jgi:hypothetical protein
MGWCKGERRYRGGEREREGFIRNYDPEGGSRAAPAHGLRITPRLSASPHTLGGVGKDFPRTLIRGSPVVGWYR